MTTPRTRFTGCALALLLALPTAQAQTDDAADAALRRALDAAEAGQPVPALNHPAQGWVEYAALRRRLDTLSVAQAEEFLSHQQGRAVAEVFRSAWLRAAYRRKDWAAIGSAWSPAISDTALTCIQLEARRQSGDTGPEWTEAVQAIWRSGGQSLPDECDAPFAALRTNGDLSDELRWERLDAAARQGNSKIMRALARALPAEQRALAEDYAAFIDAPHARARDWPKTARSREMVAIGLTRLARRSPAQASEQLPPLVSALDLSADDTGPVYYQIALQAAANWAPDSAEKLAQVPESAYDHNLHEWRVRTALARGDWPAVSAAIEKMGDTQRQQSRWTWFAARAAEHLGDVETAQVHYRHAALAADFHGFLAADKLEWPYALCPQELSLDPALEQRVSQDPALNSALALYRIERTRWAVREWNAALARFSAQERYQAVKLAQDAGWHDRAVFGMNRAAGDIRHYRLRFPLYYPDLIQRHATDNQLDPAWVAAEIRAESIFSPTARSSADARGLMQVLPSTAQGVAKRLNLVWRGADSLYDPETNITLGTAYLREKKAMYPAPYIAIAAYNAGPVATKRWQEQRPEADPDVWIETIGYRETREYVARVLAFSVIYDWRMHGSAVPVSARMLGQDSAARKGFTCPF